MKLTISQKILAFIIFVIVLFPFVVFYLLNFGNPYINLLANYYVPKHLEALGYDDEDMLEAHYIEPKMIVNNDFHHGHYMVIFKDEPDMTYYYGVTKKGKDVFQFCEKDYLDARGTTNIVDSAGQYSDEICVSMYENRD